MAAGSLDERLQAGAVEPAEYAAAGRDGILHREAAKPEAVAGAGNELEATGDKWAEQIATYLPNVVTKTLELIDRGSGAARGPVGELKPAR